MTASAMQETDSQQSSQQLDVDIVILGGGIAGLWLLSRLRQAGYQTLLLETESLGAGQTRYAQGIIHGGTKYALTGKLTASSEAVFAMPAIWRDCLQGKGEVDLSSAITLSEHQFMWSTPGLISRLSGFFAKRVMRGKTRTLAKEKRPELFQHKKFKGVVYQLDEPVLDTASLVKALGEKNRDAIMMVNEIEQIENTKDTCQLKLRGRDNHQWLINTQKMVITAGQGNRKVLDMLGYDAPEMQLRPLQMVMARGLPEKIYAHCLGASVNPRITITSHTDAKGDVVWYMGGQLAEDGVNRSEKEQVGEAERELKQLMPWLDFEKIQWATLPVNRAEPKQKEGKRPDTSFCYEKNNVITAWPTKLALSPKLAEDILQQVKSIKPSGLSGLPDLGEPEYAKLPWQEEQNWNQDL